MHEARNRLGRKRWLFFVACRHASEQKIVGEGVVLSAGSDDGIALEHAANVVNMDAPVDTAMDASKKAWLDMDHACQKGLVGGARPYVKE